MTKNPTGAWTWDAYETWLRIEWRRLLDTADPSQERPFRDFLQAHPCLLPGGEGTGESFGGHHGSWHDVAIAEPPLPGISKRYPDFMWLTKNSEDIIPVLIEVESPGKPWFNANGTRSAKLTQAQDQVSQWREQLDNPTNRTQLGEMFGFPPRWTLDYNLVPRYLLIYGRAAEFERRPELKRRRHMVRGAATTMMTFDRLRPLSGESNAICVTVRRGKPVVVSIPPTFRIGPANADVLAAMSGWDEAIDANRQLSDVRKRFLRERIPHWINCGRLSAAGHLTKVRLTAEWE
jgi:hypothetical protein